MWARRAVWVGVVYVLLLAPAAAAARSGPLSFAAPVRIDDAVVPAQSWGLNSLSCPSAQLCMGVGESGQVETSVDPASPTSWTGREISPRDALEGVSCPSVSLCAVISVRGNVLTSVDPRSGAWTRRAGVIADTGVTGGISCPTVSLCVAVQGSSAIATSTDPQRGVWRTITLNGTFQLDSVSCPSVSLCVISDFDGNIVTATDPTGGAAAWKVTDLSANRPNPGDLFSVSCGSVSECVIGDQAGDLIASSRPTAGAGAWVVKHADQSGRLVVSCVTSLQCVAADDGGNVFSSTDPAVGDPWKMTTDVDPAGIYSLACLSPVLCVAGDSDGSMMSSSDLGANWTIGQGLGPGAVRRAALGALSCPRVSLCVAVDSDGNQLTSVNPAGGKWTTRTINPGLDPTALSCTLGGFCAAVGQYSTVASIPDVLSAGSNWRLGDLSRYPPGNAYDPIDSTLNDVSCVSRSLCVATRYDHASNFSLEVSRDPGGPPSSWHPVAIGLRIDDDFVAVSCAGAKLCVAGDNSAGKLAVSTDAAARWHLVSIAGAGAGINGVSCPNRSFCAAVTDSGHLITSSDPAGGPNAWHSTPIDPHHQLDEIACASRSLCAAYDGRGRVFVSAHPAGGAATWHATATGQDFTDISCPSTRLCVLATSAGTVVIGRALLP